MLERDKGESESAWLGKGKGRARLPFLPVRQAVPPHPRSTLQGKQPVWVEEEVNVASDIYMGTEMEWKQWTLLQESINHIQNAGKQRRYKHTIIHQCICTSLSTGQAANRTAYTVHPPPVRLTKASVGGGGGAGGGGTGMMEG